MLGAIRQRGTVSSSRPMAAERWGFGRVRHGYAAGMKAKTAFYAAVGFVTYKVGKILAKRKAREAFRGSESDKGK